MSSPQHFDIYPQSYPANPYYPVTNLQYGYTPPWTTDQALGLDTDMFFEVETTGTVTETEDLPRSTTTSPFKSGSKKAVRVLHTPRPPNAWILYRSDKLKAIANGEHLAGLDAVMAEAGLSTSGTDISEESSTEAKSKIAGEMPPPREPSPKKKPKKGAKEPSEGILSLGRGKTGRGLPQADISKMISMLWKRETPDIRASYEHMSEMKKVQVSFIPFAS